MNEQFHNKLPRVMAALLDCRWLITPDMHKVLTDIVAAHAFGGAGETKQHAVAAQMEENAQRETFEIRDGIAVLPIEGVIGRKFADVIYSSGVTSVDVAQRMFESAIDDETVRGVVLAFDSPGGHVTGVPEFASAIKAGSKIKPVVAFCDGQCASAAYWLASQATIISAIPSASVGSIGCYAPFLDQSRAAEMAGLRVKMFTSGIYKGMGYPGTELTESQAKLIQQSVDHIAAQFKAAVRGGRGNLSDDLMQGQSFDAETAVKNNLIDGITSGVGQAIRDCLALS